MANNRRVVINVEVDQQMEVYVPGIPSQGILPRIDIYERPLKSHKFYVNAGSTMGSFVSGVYDLIMKNKNNFGVLDKSSLLGVQILKVVNGEDVWKTLDSNSRLKTVEEVVVDDPKDDNWITMVFRLGVENNPSQGNPNVVDESIGCNFCGKHSEKTKMEPSGQKRTFCDKECQKRFYAGMFVVNIEEATTRNPHYRVVINTTTTQQLVLMSISPEDKEIGKEIHPHTTQMIRIEGGKGQAIVDGTTIELKDGSLIMVNPGAEHNIINTSREEDLKLYSIYSPPHHAPGTIHKRKTDE